MHESPFLISILLPHWDHAAGEETHNNQKEQQIFRIQFYGRTEPKRPATGHEATQTNTGAELRLALFLASFGFYLFTRSTTMNARGSTPLFLYQLAMLLAESLHFFSGCLIGIWQVLSHMSWHACLHCRTAMRVCVSVPCYVRC